MGPGAYPSPRFGTHSLTHPLLDAMLTKSPITDCIAGAVQNRLVRLKKKAEADMGGSVSASPAAANGAETAGPAEGNGGGAVEISTGSPKKRKAAPRKKKGEESPKKVKPEPESEPEDGDQDMI